MQQEGTGRPNPLAALHKVLDLAVAQVLQAEQDHVEAVTRSVETHLQAHEQGAQALAAQVAELRRVFLSSVEAKDQQLSALQDALLREQSLSELDSLRPLIHDLLGFADALQMYAETLSAEPPPDRRRWFMFWSKAEEQTAPCPAAILSGLQQDLYSILSRFGVQVITGTGGRLDPMTQKAVSTAPTDDPDEDGVTAIVS